jgi:nitrous oxidase accessory protein
MSPLTLVGKRTDTTFEGNYWSDNDEPDLDGDGRSDRPYRLSSVFDHLRGNLTAADLMAEGFAARALGVAERTFPVLDPISVEDHTPLARPPLLPDVPSGRQRATTHNAFGLGLSFAGLALGVAGLARGRARHPRKERRA